jgi:branched-chain amino acid transport system substrate-binding protein
MRLFRSSVIAVAFLLATSCAQAETIKIGLIADFTGAFAAWGAQFQQAIDAYQALNGKTVKGPDGKDIQVQFI